MRLTCNLGSYQTEVLTVSFELFDEVPPVAATAQLLLNAVTPLPFNLVLINAIVCVVLSLLCSLQKGEEEPGSAHNYNAAGHFTWGKVIRSSNTAVNSELIQSART